VEGGGAEDLGNREGADDGKLVEGTTGDAEDLGGVEGGRRTGNNTNNAAGRRRKTHFEV